MKKTVDELLQMIHERVVEEPESFAKTGVLRRLAQFRQIIGGMKQLQVNIPKPVMSKQGKKLLKNSPKVPTRRSSRKSAAKPKTADKPKPATVVAAKPKETVTVTVTNQEEDKK